jgi:hypothetical protein
MFTQGRLRYCGIAAVLVTDTREKQSLLAIHQNPRGHAEKLDQCMTTVIVPTCDTEYGVCMPKAPVRHV